jgi:UPF0148 protein
MSEEDVKRKMVNLLRSGATMLADQCPRCGGIVFRLKSGETVCPRCELSEKEEELKSEVKVEMVSSESIFASLEETLITKLSIITSSISESQDISRIRELVQICNDIISVIDRLRNLRKR